MMMQSEFLINFSEKYSVKHIKDIESGIIVDNIKEDIYLVEDKRADVR